MKKSGKNVPYFKKVLLNTKFFYMNCIFHSYTDIKVEFEYLGVLDAPMNLL